MISYTTEKQKVAGETGCREKYIMLRMCAIFAVCFIGFTVVLGRALYLHLSDNPELSWIADKQYNARIPLSVRRGKLFDRNGEELAVSLPVPSLYADPELVEDPEAVAKGLSQVLGISERELLKKLGSGRRFVWIKRRMSYETLQKVLAFNFKGVDYIEESKRFYPNSELASQILGAVGYDSEALAGIELAYSDVLVSKKRSSSYKRDARGRVYMAPLSFGEQSDVGQVYLTIDKQIQFITENALRSAVKEFNASDGVAVVMDPETGDILAMASAPVFDPNRYSRSSIASWRNRPVTDAFEPGSTFKVFIVSAALENGAANTESVYNCEGGAIRIGEHTLKDHHPYGKLSVQDIIKYSSNIGALKIAFNMDKKALFETLKNFGIGSKTEVDYPGEADGVLRHYETWQPVERATVAFGQGLSATPLQITAAFSAVVNGGRYFRPHLVARVADRDGGVVQYEPEIVSHPIGKNVSDTMRYMLKRVVEEGGTGTKAASKAYSIGGKTGTAQKVAGGSGYAKGKYFASFIGFAPVENPRLVVFVGLDEPKGSYYGGLVAAPAVKSIIERSLNRLGVPAATSEIMYTAAVGSVPNGVVKTYEGAERQVMFKKIGEDKFIMPDLTGFTMRDILISAENILDVDADGSGIAVMQKPPTGGVIEKGEKFSVRFELPN